MRRCVSRKKPDFSPSKALKVGMEWLMITSIYIYKCGFLFQSHFDSLTFSPKQEQQQPHHRCTHESLCWIKKNSSCGWKWWAQGQPSAATDIPRIVTCISCPVLFNDTVSIPDYSCLFLQYFDNRWRTGTVSNFFDVLFIYLFGHVS